MESSDKKRILVVGSNGQLGWELLRNMPPDCHVSGFSRTDLDITNVNAVNDVVQSIRPQWIINAAAYTAVDAAESDIDTAYAVNSEGAFNLGLAARKVDSRMLQVSTDFVFNGAGSTPYRPGDNPDPLNVYGASKRAGETRVLDLMGGDAACILRTSWVYSCHGNNFVKTMLRLMVDRQQLNVVADQIGTPTWASGLAQAIYKIINLGLTGIHHWSDAGVASWYDFAVAIYDEAVGIGLLKNQLEILPIPSARYPTPARRPSYSVLDKTDTWSSLDVKVVHWRHNLRKMLKDMLAEGYSVAD